jgi:predicted nucleotide-binding protein
MPTPPAGRCQQLVQATWNFAQEQLRWPTFAELDRMVDRDFGIEILGALREMPPGILYGAGPGSPAIPADSQRIGLTVAGIAACPGTDEILSLYIDFIQLATQAERNWRPPSGKPDSGPQLGIGDLYSHTRVKARSAHEILPLIIETEQMGWGVISFRTRHDWGVSLTRDIRRFRNIASIDDYWSKRQEPQEPQPGDSSAHVSDDAPVFIVHGTDTLRAGEVAHAVSSATGRKTIILREQPNLGRTLIEKFEQHAAEVSYAIIILTPDDKGCRADEPATRPRGRQNVVFEMGYFYGRIGRANVCVLLSPGVEKPSDVDGLAYITLDDRGAWKEKLFRELRHVGFDITR